MGVTRRCHYTGVVATVAVLDFAHQAQSRPARRADDRPSSCRGATSLGEGPPHATTHGRGGARPAEGDGPELAAGAPERYTWAMPKKKRPFLVEIEAKLTVHAFDEDSARKKVEKAFASGRPLGSDVEAGAGVWTYAVVAPEEAPGG